MSELAVPVNKKDHTQGSGRASVTLVEYGDYECPYCGEAYYIIKKLQTDMKDRMRFVFRNFPLSQIHPHAVMAALAAEAAGLQSRFWEMHDMIYEHQEELEEQNLVSFAYALGLDIDKFIQDMNSNKVQQKVHDDFWGGIRSGVNGTPTFFIHGKRYNGLYSYAQLRQAIETAIKTSSKVSV